MGKYIIGRDFSTHSARALIVDERSGEEIGSHAWDYRRGDQGVILDAKEPDLVRQRGDHGTRNHRDTAKTLAIQFLSPYPLF